jgi:hypothetical protein
MFDPFVVLICLESLALLILVVIWVGIDFHHVVPHGHLVPEWIALIYPPSNGASSDPNEVGDTSRAFPYDRTGEELRVAAVDE